MGHPGPVGGGSAFPGACIPPSAVPKSVPFWAELVGARRAPDLSSGPGGPAAPLAPLAPHAISGNTVVGGQGGSPVAVTLLRRYRDILPRTHWLLVPAMATGRERTWPPGVNLAREAKAKGRPSQWPVLQGRGLGPPCWPEAHLWGLGCEWGCPGNLGGHVPHPCWRAPLEIGPLPGGWGPTSHTGLPGTAIHTTEPGGFPRVCLQAPACWTLSLGLGVKIGDGERGCRPRLSPDTLSKCPTVFAAPSSGQTLTPSLGSLETVTCPCLPSSRGLQNVWRSRLASPGSLLLSGFSRR